MTETKTESEPQRPLLSGFRKALLWLIGAGALAIVGYRGALGTEVAVSPPPVVSPPPAVPHLSAVPTASALTVTEGRPAPPATAPSAEKGGHNTGGEQGSTAAGPTTSPVASVVAVSAGSAAAAITQDGKVVLNLASETELQRLPGIGRARAKAIIEQRERVGRFRRLEDLLRVKGIGAKRLAVLRSKLVLDPPVATP